MHLDHCPRPLGVEGTTSRRSEGVLSNKAAISWFLFTASYATMHAGVSSSAKASLKIISETGPGCCCRAPVDSW